eukprot:11805191-Karenia_brevis.AAC.1
MLQAHGSAGDDGWTASEIRAVAKYIPVMKRELTKLWQDTTMAAPALLATQSNGVFPADVLSLVDFIWSWRTAGMPKKNDFLSRPISVGSHLVRAWHRALHTKFPLPRPYQWAGRANTSVVDATANWLSVPQGAGAE